MTLSDTEKLTHRGYLEMLLDNLRNQETVKQFMSHSVNIAECTRRLDDLRDQYAEDLTLFVKGIADRIGFDLVPKANTIQPAAETSAIVTIPTDLPNVVMLAEEKLKEVAV